MRGTPPTFLVVLGLLTVSLPVEAQYLPDQVTAVRSSPTLQAPQSRSRNDGGGAAVGAIVGGAAGMVLVGYGVFYLAGGNRICGDDPCGLWYGLMGALVGEAVGIGLGAHLGNGRRGNALAPIAASLGVLLLAGAIGDHVSLPDGAVIVVPLAQIVAAVLTETSIARARARR